MCLRYFSRIITKHNIITVTPSKSIPFFHGSSHFVLTWMFTGAFNVFMVSAVLPMNWSSQLWMYQQNLACFSRHMAHPAWAGSLGTFAGNWFWSMLTTSLRPHYVFQYSPSCISHVYFVQKDSFQRSFLAYVLETSPSLLACATFYCIFKWLTLKIDNYHPPFCVGVSFVLAQINSILRPMQKYFQVLGV